ncbi:MAG: hypothetical protein IJ493_07235 [Clostridia bacterium]|nr:hypothetical protein [Clostridia bacterium]
MIEEKEQTPVIILLLNVFVFPSMLTRTVTEVSYDTFLNLIDEGQRLRA